MIINTLNKDKSTPFTSCNLPNSASLNDNHITQANQMNVGDVTFEMSGKPNKKWATQKDAVPYSLSIDQTAE
jgi:putative alpha-1,2-mannosidase